MVFRSSLVLISLTPLLPKILNVPQYPDSAQNITSKTPNINSLARKLFLAFELELIPRRKEALLNGQSSTLT